MAEARPTLPRLITEWPVESLADGLLTTVAQTLSISKYEIQLFDSFSDLGGDDAAAVALRQACRRKGIDVKTEDVMGCRTLAELQTRVTPYPAPGHILLAGNVAATAPAPAPAPAPDSEGTESGGSSDDETFSHGRRPTRDSMSSYGSLASRFSTSCRSSPPPLKTKAEMEDLLLTTSKVDKACLLTPKAGPFDGQLVALLTLSGPLPSPSPSSDISLPPAAKIDAHRKEIQSLRTAVQEWGHDTPRPEVWIILQSMALKEDGKPDLRQLKTWVQNINEDAFNQIMKLQLPEPSQRMRKSSTVAIQSSPEKQTPTWGSKGPSDSDETGWRESTVPLEEVECFALSTMQQLYFQSSSRNEQDPLSGPDYRFSQSILLRIKGAAALADIEAAVEALVSRHDMLRARFRLTEDGWAQAILPQAENSYRFAHHTADTQDDVEEIIQQTQAVINPTDGPVFAAEHILRTDNDEELIFLIAHHLIVDLMSWRVMTHDLDELLQQGTLYTEGSIPFPHWLDYQAYEMSQRLVEPSLPFEPMPTNLRYWDLSDQPNCYGDTDWSSFTLTSELSAILQESCVRVLRAEPADVFLTALLLSFSKTFPDRAAPTIWKQEHGRDVSLVDFNITDTVGWFTSLCPVSIGLESTDFFQLMKLMKDSRRAIPRSGIPFFASEFSTPEGQARNIPVEIMFNCFDTIKEIQRKDGFLEPIALPGQAVRSLNSDIGSKVGRIALFEVSVQMSASGARVEFLANRFSKHRERIGSWMQGFEHLVLEAIARLRIHEPELTLSDVPLLKTTYEGLSKLTSDRLAGSGLPDVRDMETIYPVTPAQQEILIAQGQDSESFQVFALYELRAMDGGPVDTSRLCAAWKAIVAAQPAMRSIFIESVSEDGLFDQVVLKKVSPNMLFLESGRPEEALNNVPSLKAKQFEPKHRLSVCHTDQKTLLRVDASQAICDLTAIHSLVADLTRVYSGQWPCQNEILYHTYLYHTSTLETDYSLEVWKVDLCDAKPCLFPRLSAQENIQHRSLDLETTPEELLSFSQKRAIDPAVVLQLAWALMLRAFIGTDHVTFGNELSGRDETLLPGIHGVIGSFATSLPCSIEFLASRTVEQCLFYFDEAFANAKQHQNLTMAEIQHALRFRNKALFNTSFLFQSSEGYECQDAQGYGELIPTMLNTARQSNCDLSITTMFVNNRIHANLSSRYLTNTQAQNVTSSFERALKVIIESPTLKISEVDLFTERDYAQLVVQDWESKQRPGKVSACLHNMILEHAANYPDAPAVCAWDGLMTYGQLANLVTRLTTYLVNLGVGPGTAVPVVLEKNRWAPVIMLSVMQAGAAFIALDSQDSVTVDWTIRQLNPQVVIASETAWRGLGTMAVNLLIINNAFFATMAPQTCFPAQQPGPENAACVFISPGKTKSGPARSIFFTHSALCSAFVAQGPALKLDRRSRVLQLSSFNVDIALVETLGTMLHGGCVCVPSAEERIYGLAGAISRMNVTWTYMTGVLARKIDPAAVPSLRTLCFRTRKLDEDTYGPWLDRDVLLVYGAPDVCPLGISVTRVETDKDLSIIARPVTGRFWLLNPDNSQKLMPVGAIGELAIDSPEVTRHKFSPGQPLAAPDSTTGSKSFYLKTGHRVRYMDDGNIQFVSSIRDDIVIDGDIVDIVGVESHVRRCVRNGVDVVVDVITTKDGEKVLAAFLELGEVLFQGPGDLTNLSHAVKEQTFIARKCFEGSLEKPETKLAPCSIPAVFIPVKHFPISTSLKINRRKLQRMVTSLSFSQLVEMSNVPNAVEVEQIALSHKPLPLTGPEEVMRSLWSRVLSIPASDISGSSNFISLGGYTFLAAEMVVASRKMGLHVSIHKVLKGASLTDICRGLDTAEAVDSSNGKASALTGYSNKFLKDIIAPQLRLPWQNIVDITLASPTQIRNLELGMRSERADIVCIVLSFNGSIHAQKLEAACDALTRMHPALRTAFAMHEGSVYQVLGSCFKTEFSRVACPPPRLTSITEKMIKKDQALAFNPRLPVTKFTFVDAGEHGSLVVRLSRAQINEASAALLIQDLQSVYGDANSVQAKSSFFEYMRATQPGNATDGLEYWKERLEGAKMTEIVSHNKPCSPTTQIGTVQETVKVSSLGAYGFTFDIVIKAAWAVALATLSGQMDILFGEVVHGNNAHLADNVDLVSMVGPLSNTIPVRARFPSIHSPPITLLQYMQNQRLSNRRFESMGLLDLAKKCTDWPAWTRFSSVVHHRFQMPADGSTTLNMGGATFTYKTVEPKARDLPDLLICSTFETADCLSLSIQYPEDRVDGAFARDALMLLASAVRLFTSYDTLMQPILPAAEDITRSTKRVPLPQTSEQCNPEASSSTLLTNAQRVTLQTCITNAWTEILKPADHGIQGDALNEACFYNLGGALLPAHLLAELLNRELPKLNIDGLHKIRITPQTVLDHPSVADLVEHVAHRLYLEGALSPPSALRRSNHNKTLGPKTTTTDGPLSPSAMSWATVLSPSKSVSSPRMWKNSIRRLHDQRSRTMQSIGHKASGWVKQRASFIHESNFHSTFTSTSTTHSSHKHSNSSPSAISSAISSAGPVSAISPASANAPLPLDSPERAISMREHRDLASLGGFVGGMVVEEEAVEHDLVSPLSPVQHQHQHQQYSPMRGTLFGAVTPLDARVGGY